MATKAITDENFETQVIKSEKPILVDYWAEWCGPCKMIAPILEEVASEIGDKVLIGKLNVDENSETPPKYGIRGIPTLMLFVNGEVVGTQVGALSKNDLIKFLLNLNIVVSNEETAEKRNKKVQINDAEKKVGRNEKCPCGSGKKFKHCHGNI